METFEGIVACIVRAALVAVLGHAWSAREGRRQPADRPERLQRQGRRARPCGCSPRRATTSRGRQQQRAAPDRRDRAQARSSKVRPRSRARASAPRVDTIDPDGSYDVSGRTSTTRTSAGRGRSRRHPAPDAVRGVLASSPRTTPNIVKLETIGHSVNGKPIIALRITRDAREPTNPDGSRPAALYMSTQHAREWITAEQTRRLAHLFVDNYGGSGPAQGHAGARHRRRLRAARSPRLVNTREIWIMPIANPDGYDFTFTPGNRQWRKNLRDNNGDNQITARDGVDPNRNYPRHWGFDHEGSSADPTTRDLSRHRAGARSPRRRPWRPLAARRLEFLVNYHSAAELLLYGTGFQVQTTPRTTRSTARSRAPTRTRRSPATRPARRTRTTRSSRPSCTRPTATSTTTRARAARHAGVHPRDGHRRPGARRRRLGLRVPGLRGRRPAGLREEPPVRARPREVRGRSREPDVAPRAAIAPSFEMHPFSVSFGDPQTVRVNVKRVARAGLAALDGRRRRTSRRRRRREYNGGERYGGDLDVYYHEMRGHDHRDEPGRPRQGVVRGRRAASQSFGYDARSDSGSRVLILAAEDYRQAGPHDRVPGLRRPRRAELPAATTRPR